MSIRRERRTAHGVGGLEVMIAPERKCPMSKDKFLGNEKNKKNFIAYLCELISVNFETTVANDDSDTLIAKKAIDLSASSSVEVMKIVMFWFSWYTMVPRQLGIYSSQRKREASASKISLLT